MNISSNGAAAAELLKARLAGAALGEGSDLVFGAPRSFSSLSELRGFGVPQLVTGQSKIAAVESFHGGWAVSLRGPVGGGSFAWIADMSTAPVAGIVEVPNGHTGPGRWVRIGQGSLTAFDFGAWGNGINDDSDAITAADAWIAANPVQSGGELKFPPGIFRITRSMAQTPRVSWVGDGSRQSVIRWGKSDLSGYDPKGMVYCVAGSDGAPDFVFSTNLKDLCFDGAGVIPVPLAIRGHQENCEVKNLLLLGFVAAGLDILSFNPTTHGVSFSDIHSVPAPLATSAYGIRGARVSKCVFSNITTDIENGGYYARGISLSDEIVLNTFEGIHTEDCLFGIHVTGGADNTYKGLEAINNVGNGVTHFYTTDTRYTINGIRTRSGFANHIQDAAHTIPAGTDTDSVLVERGGSHWRRIGDQESSETTLSGVGMTRGAAAAAGLTGNGQTYLRVNAAISALGSIDVVVDVGAENVGFSGQMKLFSTGDQRYCTSVYFHGFAGTSGAVSTASVSAQAGSNTTVLSIGAPQALASPAAGKFRIGISNLSTFVQSLEAQVEISVAGRQAVSVEAS